MHVKIRPLTGILAACAMVGGQRAMARALKCSPQTVNNWVEAGFCPPSRAQAIEELLGGKILREDLNPIFRKGKK